MPVYTYTLDQSLADYTIERRVQDQSVIKTYWELRSEGIIIDEHPDGVTTDSDAVSGISTLHLNVVDGYETDPRVEIVKTYFNDVWSKGNL